jgi:cytochrome P450
MSDYNHLERANDLEPSASHAFLRENHPLYRAQEHDPPFAVVSRYDDVIATLKDSDMWQNRKGSGVFYQEVGVLGSADDPDHRRQRTVLNDSFRPAQIDLLRPVLEAKADELWQPFEVPGEGDFVDLFAFRLPALAIAALLGVQAEDQDQFRVWTEDIVAALGGGDMQAYHAATEGIWGYVDILLDARLALAAAGEPLPNDVLSTMSEAVRAGNLSRDEVRRLGHQLLVAGHETTASLISFMMYRLIQQPELVQQLRDHPDLLGIAVEEFIRFDSPVQGLFRTNAQACPVRGVELPESTKMQVMYASANRDERIWDDADSIRFDRSASSLRRHVGFGWGLHHCIGAPLARLEAKIALERMVQRFESVELLQVPRNTAPFVLRGLRELSIRWTPRLATNGHR